jgi:hypothetical protein
MAVFSLRVCEWMALLAGLLREFSVFAARPGRGLRRDRVWPESGSFDKHLQIPTSIPRLRDDKSPLDRI